MARHLARCLARTLIIANRPNAIRLSVPALRVSDHVATKPNVENAGIGRFGTDMEEPRDIGKFEDDAKNGTKVATAALRKILSISQEKAEKALLEYPIFKTMAKRTIYHNFEILRGSGIYKSTIKNHKFLMAIPTTELISKVECIKPLDVDINDVACLLRLNTSALKDFQEKVRIDASYLPSPNRLHYLSERLQCDMKELCDLISYNPYMLRLQPTKLLTFTEYLLETGMRPEHIRCDLLVYRYSFSTLKTKVDRAKELGIHPLRPWVARCSDDQWRRLEKRAATQEIPINPHFSREEHLCDIFGCSVDEAKYLLVRDPKIGTMATHKLAVNARVVRNAGYEFHDVILSPLIMHYSTKRLKARLAEWEAAGLPRPRLFTFGLPEAQYRGMINAKLEAAKNVTNPEVDG